ncbi:Puromycin-sensitive aminopeptidase-like protein, partial [Leptotrombidium deliense]
DVKVAEQTNKIVLNAHELVINSASFQENGREIKVKDWKVDPETETATLTFDTNIETGDGQLTITFTGTLNDKLHGFYRSQYTTPSGEVRYAATTQFESTYARQAFPCWDEPAIKARFNVTLVVPKDRVALSNMNVIGEEDDIDPSRKVVKFATTPIMSTYLLAFIVGEYDFIEDVTENGVKIRAYTPVGKTEQGKFALSVAVRSLPFYEKYFNIPYPLPKMDLIAIADFEAGAMENWGLVTFRETCVLFDEKNTSTSRKQWIALVVAHELAHQWFGNLVTMDWWTHLWLNEGFAKFSEYLCVDKLYPEFNIWMQFVPQITLTGALVSDALHNSHPIEVPVGHPSEVSEIFDTISYHKGASIIRMLYEYIGDECFSKGLSLYLKRHSYKNAVTEDLWAALEEVSKKPIGKIMSTWTKQKGFPVISVNSRQEGNNRILTLSQEKFCSNGKLSEEDKQVLWMVPISISTQSDPSKEAFKVLLDSKSTETVLTGVSPNEWIKLNPNCVSFYRVHYTSEMSSQFLSSVKDKSMPPLDRLGLQNDLFAMVQEGRASTVDLLKLLEAFVDEEHYSVWDSINVCLGHLNNLLSYTDFQDHFHVYGKRLLSKISAKLGWNPAPNESLLDTNLRPLIIGRLVTLKDEATIAEAKRRFDAFINNDTEIPADVRAAVYKAVALSNEDSVYDTFLTLYRKSDMQEEKNRILSGIAGMEDAQKLRKLLEFGMSEEVRLQDSAYVIIYVAMNKIGRDVAWRFFQENFSELHARYSQGFIICSLVEHTTKNFASEEKAAEIEEFFTSHPVPAASRALQQGLESIRLKAEWLSRDNETVKSFLSSYV